MPHAIPIRKADRFLSAPIGRAVFGIEPCSPYPRTRHAPRPASVSVRFRLVRSHKSGQVFVRTLVTSRGVFRGFYGGMSGGLKFVREIRRNRLTRTLDSIQCRNGKCRYECVWAKADDGRWLCVYALDLYGWSDLGDIVHFDRVGCVGCYEPGFAAPPSGAAVATALEFRLEPSISLDPFHVQSAV